MAMLGFAGIPTASAASSSAVYQTINYHGYEIQVPASWPVYDLAADPTRCVLFNRHAVYLGTPGADQHCPTRAYGRTEAVLVQPEPSSVSAGAVELGPDTASFSGALSADEATVHTVQFTAPGPGVQVTASYGTDEAGIRAILSGARMTAKTAAKAPVVSSPQATAGTSSASASGQVAGQVAGSGSATPVKKAATSSGLSAVQGQGLGIDTCTVPSAATMKDWLASPYRVISTYLGGANWACTYGDFTPGWVGQVAAEGWKFIPIWVGPQASCTQLTNTTVIDPANAAAQGEAEAASAVAAAQQFGYGQGTPIYYDMESYSTAAAGCSQATLTFLGGWTAGLHAAGYLSGVYSSAATGIADLASQYTNSAYQSPDDVWFADWNGNPVLVNPYAPQADWQGAIMHQYYGDHYETWGGDTLQLDSDVVDAAVAGDADASAGGQATITDEPAAVSVSPGGDGGTTQLTIQAGPRLSAVHWRAEPPAGVTVSPSSGIAVLSGNSQATVSLHVTGAASLASGRYAVPITASANGQQVTETFLLVSNGSSIATPVVLYAADADSMAIAQAEAQELALPASNLTGDFETAWTDAASGSDLVIAVGTAASNALFHNACGWTNPAGEAMGHTPFGYAAVPLQNGAGGVFEGADGSNDAATRAMSEQFAQYAMAGTVPNDSADQPLGSITPANTCLGSPDVPTQ
ncbi:DUF1906 domain-containing protein [Actinospica sp. MGRD01-02]|uniref:DUF1906 domain-containing protein n=1 Tax=Actinospica acidithermotolerans TaxID=2828514 RepID=A0A941IKT5_9ACTN|nr:DUF1906 domain-containing protein [Actinospica acidithermotolerans]MBR7829272.1 DUF1906 domain-containing protein [Actinospica acidithermotolerans]